MKRIFVMLVLLVCCSLAFGQKSRVRISVSGGPDAKNETLGEFLDAALTNSPFYIPTERSETGLTKMDDEIRFTKTDYVNPTSIKEWGKQYGAAYICDVRIKYDNDFKQYRIMAKLLNTETGDGVASVKTPLYSALDSPSEVKSVSAQLVSELLSKQYAIEGIIDEGRNKFTFTDDGKGRDSKPRDGKKYVVWRIGKKQKQWFMENLRLNGQDEYDRFKDGTFKGKKFNKEEENVRASDASIEALKEACPVGWDVPTKTDWNELKAAWNEDPKIKEEFYKGYKSGKGYWWSATPGHCEDEIVGPTGCKLHFEKIDKNKDSKDNWRYVYPALRCVKD